MDLADETPPLLCAGRALQSSRAATGAEQRRRLIGQVHRWLIVAVIAAVLTAACTATTTETSIAPPTTPTAAPTTTVVAPTTTPAPPTTTTTITPPEVVTVWADEATAGALEAIAGDFTTRRGTVVEIVELPFPSIRSDVLAAADGTGPDLFVGASSWTGVLRDAGAIIPIRGIPLAQREQFIQPALDGFLIDGASYGVPYAAETIALWVNVDLAGAERPATFDDLLDRCDDLRADAVCLAVAGGAGVPEAYYQYPFITAFGGSILRYEDGVGYVADRAGIDEPESIAASVFLAALGRGDYLPPLDYVEAKRRFLEGEVAFWLTGHWEAAAIAEAQESRGFVAAVIPVPPIDGAPARPFVDAFGIFLGSGASTEARIFLTDWIATGGAMISLSPPPPLLPAHEEPAARLGDPTRTPFVESLRTGVPTPNLAAMTDQIWDTWGSALSTIRDERADPATTLQNAARIIRGVLGLPQPGTDG